MKSTIPFAFRVFEVVLMGRSPHLGTLGFESDDDLARARIALERVGAAHLADRSALLLHARETPRSVQKLDYNRMR